MRTLKRAAAATKRASALRLLGLVCICTAVYFLLRIPIFGAHQSSIQLDTVHISDGIGQGIHLAASGNDDPGMRIDSGQSGTAKASPGGSSGNRQPSKRAPSPKAKKPVRPADLVLTKEMAEAAATGVDGVTRLPVIVTWANAHFLEFLDNWVAHINATGCRHNYLVGALDAETLTWLIDHDVPAFPMAANFTSESLVWGSDAFFDMGIEKIRLIRTFVRWGLDVFVTDVDAIFIGCPMDYLARFPQADFLVSTDAMETSLKGDEPIWKLETPAVAAAALSNIGVILVRASAPAKVLVEAWVVMIEKDHKYWDQNAFNDLWWSGLPRESNGNLLLGYNQTVKVGTLPLATFCSGHAYFVDRLPQKSGRQPYVIHNTFVFSGERGKRHRFREEQLWRPDGPEYSEGQYVIVANSVPQNLKAAVASAPRSAYINSTTPHFDLMNAQLTTLRALFGAATALQRGAVLPQLWCGLDKYWWTHDGVIPGSNMKVPYECPADHLLDLFAMTNDFPPDTHGPALPFRESSFLRKFTTDVLRNETVVVNTCGPDSPPQGTVCADGSSPAAVAGGQVWLRPGLTGAQLAVALGEGSPASRYKFLFFREAAAAWGGFDDAAVAERFKRRLDSYASIWCCSTPDFEGGVGNVFYDFFWDQEHMDQFGREWNAARPWEPTMDPKMDHTH